MNQRTIHWNPSSGVWGYGAAWPNNGPWAVTLPGVGVQTGSGIVPPSPGASLMYLDVNVYGQIGGQGHQGDRVWFYDVAWHDKAIAWGPHAAVFNAFNALDWVKTQSEYQETGGWRYGKPDGTLMPCVASYADPARGLYEWTEWSDIAIGQGGKPDEGAVVWTPERGLLRLSFQALRADGELRCIVAKRVGNDFAITVIDPRNALTTITYATLAELQALPAVVVPKPPTEPPPIDPPPVDPPPTQPPPTEPPIPPITGVPMQTERGWLIGPGDRVLSCSNAGVVSFNVQTLTDADLLEATPQPDGRCTVRPVAHITLCLGADATAHTPTGNVCAQYYGTDREPGNYELWTFGQWPSGIVQAVVEYTTQGADNGRKWQAAGLTWVRQS